MKVTLENLGAIPFTTLADVVKDDSDAKAAIDYAEEQTPGRVAIVVGDSLLSKHPGLFRTALAVATKQALETPDSPVCAIFNGELVKAFPTLESAVNARSDGEFPHVHLHIIAVAF
tara:strand:+ start:325 stop:672 length:348 start_codon:yes stop_codon:yes gene_type:complete